jgi:DnaK suppressor protein
MTPDQLEQFRQHLLTLRQELLRAEETGGQAEQTVELDQARVGRLSRMDALQGQAMSRETGRRRRLLLREVDRALLRIEAGEYGECLGCGEQIDPRRLNAGPANTLCISCAEGRE